MGTIQSRTGLLLSLFCGWVLWQSAEGSDLGRQWKSWFLEGAEETRALCDEQLKKLLDSKLSRPPARGWTRKTWGTIIDEANEDRTKIVSIQLWCLPAGTDPRPRFKE